MRRQTKVREAQYKRPLYRELIGRIAANVRRLRESSAWTQEEAAFQCDGMATYVFQCVEGLCLPNAVGHRFGDQRDDRGGSGRLPLESDGGELVPPQRFERQARVAY